MNCRKYPTGSPLLVTTVRLWSELDHCMQWNLDVRQVSLREVVEVCVATQSISAYAGSHIAVRAETDRQRRIA